MEKENKSPKAFSNTQCLTTHIKQVKLDWTGLIANRNADRSLNQGLKVDHGLGVVAHAYTPVIWDVKNEDHDFKTRVQVAPSQEIKGSVRVHGGGVLHTQLNHRTFV